MANGGCASKMVRSTVSASTRSTCISPVVLTSAAADSCRPLPQRMPALDGVRGLAILLVVMHNFSLLSEPHGVGASLLAAWLDRGWVGVQLFFVLSGFLITGILLDMRKSLPRRDYFFKFYGRRFLRIFPLYYFYLIIVALLTTCLISIPYRPIYMRLFLNQLGYAA